jgi:hypothetical protein
LRRLPDRVAFEAPALPAPVIRRDEPPTFNRTPLRVFFLDVATFTMYSVCYLIRNCHLAQLRYDAKRRPLWTWLGLLVRSVPEKS